MANYATLKAAIQQVVKTNGNNEITGALLQQSLLAMINSLGTGFQYMGIATPTTNPGTPDQNVFYLASTAGTYSNFGGIVLNDGEISVLKYNGSWSKDLFGAASLEQVLELLSALTLNMYNESGYIATNGTEQANTSYKRTPFIEYNGGKIYIQNTYNGGSSLAIAFYDENKTFISGIAGSDLTKKNYNISSIPAGTKFFRCSTYLGAENTMVFYYVYKDFSDEINKLTNESVAMSEILSENLQVTIPFNKNGYITAAGVFIENSSYASTGLFPKFAYEKITYCVSIGGNQPAISFYDENGNIIPSLSVLNGYGDVVEIDLTQSQYDDVYFIALSNRVASQATGFYAILSSETNINNIIQELLELQEQINVNSNKIEELSEELVSNKTYPLTDDGFVSWGNGAVYSTQNAKNTGKIPIDARGILRYYVYMADSGTAVAFYDENQNYLQTISIRGNGYTQGEIDLSDSAYNNAKYFTLSYYDGSHAFAYYICELVFPDDTIGNRIAALENNPTVAKNPLNILIFGDSITDAAQITIVDNKTSAYSVNQSYQNSYVNGQGQTIYYCMWPFLITKYFKTFDVRNYAMAGASYKDQNDPNNPRLSLAYQIQLAINDIPNTNNVFPTEGNYVPDIIIFALGTNDGTPNDTFEDAMNKTVMDGNNFDVDATIANLDRSKFCEAARYAFLKVKQQFPDALYICVLPIQRVSIDIQQNGVNNELRKMAERYSMIVVDGASNSGIVRDIEKYNALGVNLKDGLHPNDKGQNLMTRMIVNAIKNNWVDDDLMNP